MTVEVVVPYAGDCAHREAAWAFCRSLYPWPVTVAHSPADDWCKALAVMPAVHASTADVIVVADADCWTPRLAEAVEAVRSGWQIAVPHRSVHRLTVESTERVIAGTDPEGLPLHEHPYRGVFGGGVLVARREAILSTPLDARFTGWGQEDTAWNLALQLRHGPGWRPTDHAPLWHLWHQPQLRLSRSTGSIEGRRLWKRYYAVRHDPDGMNALLKEAHVALADHLPGVCAA